MRNRKHSAPLIAAGLMLLSSYACDASEGKVSAKDHNCNLPSNVRDKVEHCDQVGDFDSHVMGERNSIPDKSLRNRLPKPKGGSSVEELKTPKRVRGESQSIKKEEFKEVQSDAEPTKKEK